MSVSEKIEELSEEVRSTKKYIAYKEAKKRFDEDKEARELLERFQKIKGEIAILEEQSLEGLTEKKKEEERISGEVLRNKTIQDYMKARKSYQEMVEGLAVALSSQINFPIKLPEKKSCCGR